MAKDPPDRIKGTLYIYVNRNDDNTRFVADQPFHLEGSNNPVREIPLDKSELAKIIPEMRDYNGKGILMRHSSLGRNYFEQLVKIYLIAREVKKEVD